jgi:peptide subunit release factor 1 (eRF1)
MICMADRGLYECQECNHRIYWTENETGQTVCPDCDRQMENISPPSKEWVWK